MAEGVDRETKFRDSILILGDDLTDYSKRLNKCIRGRQYERAAALAADLQKTARDAKWLLHRLPKKD